MSIRTPVQIALLALCSHASLGLCAESAGLPDPVLRILDAYSVSHDGFSAYVHEIGAEEPLIAFNADVARNPASTIKLLTTFIGLESLGPTYKWKTEAWLNGPLNKNNGALSGDLVLKGYGDPYLVLERFWLFLRQLRGQGLRNIDGDLLIDDTYFDLGDEKPGDFDGEALRVYNVVPSAMLVNFQAVRLTFRPDPEEQRVQIVAEPRPANLDMMNQLRLVSGGCGGYQNGIGISASDLEVRDEIVLSGRFGRSCREYNITRTVLQPPTYTYGLFRSLWEEQGGKLKGEMRLGEVNEDMELFITVVSPPLTEVIASINKWSNNVMARHILLTMGAETFGAPATVEKGRAAAKLALRERGLEFPELVLDNGAGLSRDVRIAPASLGKVLLVASQSPWQPEYQSSLALAGLDGTMRRRFTNEEMTGRMHLKSGRLNGVYGLAGYAQSDSGRRYVVVVMQNYPSAHRGPGEEAQSALLRWVYEH